MQCHTCSHKSICLWSKWRGVVLVLLASIHPTRNMMHAQKVPCFSDHVNWLMRLSCTVINTLYFTGQSQLSLLNWSNLLVPWLSWNAQGNQGNRAVKWFYTLCITASEWNLFFTIAQIPHLMSCHPVNYSDIKTCQGYVLMEDITDSYFWYRVAKIHEGD